MTSILQSLENIPEGFCQCGCGAKTSVAKYNDVRWNRIAGKAAHFVGNHGARKREKYRVDPETGCFVWLLSTNEKGYAKTYRDGKFRKAHVVAWEERNGSVPDGLELDHTCKNRKCINPDHLEPVTHRENLRRSSRMKLSDADVVEIRRRFALGESRKSLGRVFKVTAWHISTIISGKERADAKLAT